MVCIVRRNNVVCHGRVMDFEHPPAAGTALGMTLVGYTSSSAVAIIISVLILAFISYVAKPFLRDLI